MNAPVFHFDWDPAKARINAAKHGVTFRLATSVFRDPLALTVYDDEHSKEEERWVTLGLAENHQYLVVIHTVATAVWSCRSSRLPRRDTVRTSVLQVVGRRH